MNTLPGAFGWWGETTVPGMQRARLMNVGNRSLWYLRQFGVVWSLRTLLSRVTGDCVLSHLGLPSHCRLGLCLLQDCNAHNLQRRTWKAAPRGPSQRASPEFWAPPLADGGTRVSRSAFQCVTPGSWSLQLYLAFRCPHLLTFLAWFAVEDDRVSQSRRGKL